MLQPLTLLLTTKLYQPPVTSNTVARPELLTRLHQGLSLKLTLLSAPPGFGKSTLTSQWLASCSMSSAWLTLDEGDNQLAQFLRYLIAAVRTCVPAACAITQSLLAAASLPHLDYLADVLVGELTALTGELILVLDNYHTIRSNDVHHVMRHLLRYLPPSLHLVFLTRIDPPLRLGRLRIEGQITELRAQDLRFTFEQTCRFLEQRVSQPLDYVTLQTLQARTEGWITGLQLASISLQNQDPHQFLSRFRGNDRRLAGYLIEEVMAQLPETVRTFLVRTAMMDRFCAPLADALLADRHAPGSSRTIITQLEAQNLFLIPLDDAGEWYRYQALFQDFLRHQLNHSEDQAEQLRLHQRASEWLAGANLIEAALRHALAADDVPRAAELVETQLHPMLNRQPPAATLGRWLALFTEEMIEAQPGLLLAQACLSALGMGPNFSPARFVRIEALLQDNPSLSVNRLAALQADLNLLRGIIAYWQGEAQAALNYLQATLKQQSATHEFARAQANFHLATAYASLGEMQTGCERLRTALAEEVAQQRPAQIILLCALATLQLYAGELAEVAQIVKRALAAADTPLARAAWQDVGFVAIWRGWAQYLLGMVYYEQNDLAMATYHWHLAEGMRYCANPNMYHSTLIGLALIAQAKNALDQALAYAQAAREFAVETQNLALMAASVAFETQLALQSGPVPDVLRRTQEIDTTTNQGTSFGTEFPPATRIRALLAAATPSTRVEALAIVTTCLRNAENAHNTPQVIQLGALQALVLAALRRKAEAFSSLARALLLAEPGGFVRTFLDLGTPLAELLRDFARQGTLSSYAQRLLAAFAQTHNPPPSQELTANYVKHYGITPLTPRELELLTLISQRRSIQEIATILVISANTVKKHINNVYTKLGVRNRSEAVVKAQALNLLPPT